ncbi:MAG: NADH-quinone oxidoreductase subunit H [Spirochaetaceae bacterium]|nr:NADH-quinone oxidoreductase subunit H [Spirochaetaceae bacterium]HPG24371.1 NADH-quinone oxidoreductase subunit H [Myxococcota bacterium]
MSDVVAAGLVAGVWLAVVAIALASSLVIERRMRLGRRLERPELAPPRAVWGGGIEHPPSRYAPARVLALLARMVRTRTRIVGLARPLRVYGHVVACTALAGGLALVPFGGRYGATQDGVPLVALDLAHGLVALAFVQLLAAASTIAVGLGDRSAWSRFGSVRIASRSLASTGLLLIVLAPIALEAGSLRLHDIVETQQAGFTPLGWLAAESGLAADVLRWIHESGRLPAWNVFAQPLTAVLFVVTAALVIRRPLAWDPATGHVALAGLGLDADPIDEYWARVESRLARLLAAALFVSLFLGAGAIPFVESRTLIDRLAPYFGTGLPSLLVLGLEAVVFLAKVLATLALLALVRRATAVLRDDQWIRLVTRRLIPLAWANLLLMGAILLVSTELSESARATQAEAAESSAHPAADASPQSEPESATAAAGTGGAS